MITTRRAWLGGLLATSFAGVSSWKLHAGDDKPAKVALVESVFSGQDRAKVVEQIRPFSEIVQKETGTKAIFDVFSLAQVENDLNKEEVQLVILTGLEYGWIRAKNEHAKALLVASIDPGATKTVVITKQADSAQALDKVLGYKTAVPERISFLTRFYLKKTLNKNLEDAFKLITSGNVDETIEDLLDDKAQAAIITGAGLDAYKERKPGRFKKLKIIHESPDFPPATVMYNAKDADLGAVKRFEDALLKAGQTPEGQRVLTLYRLKGFEKLPSDYDKQVAEIVKQFPRPTGE
jgi:ABC-type phosphate/phosphonate transport system substrate-binding protein